MKKIVTALASYGMSGEVFHAPLIASNEGFELKYILQRTKDTALMHYPEVIIARNFETILNDKEVELVVVNTPNQLHFPMAKACLMAGKNVVVEKPFTIKSKEAEYLIALAKEKNLLISVFHNKRLENDFLTIQKLIDENQLGEIVELELHYDRYRTHITTKKWKEDAVPGSGTLYDLGVHLIDMALQLFGKPLSVTADLRVLRKEAKATDYFNVRLDYTNTTVILKSSTLVREPVPTVQMHGYKGSFIKYGTDPQESQLKQGKIPSDPGFGEDEPAFYGILHTENNEGEVIRKRIKSVTGAYQKYYENIFMALRGYCGLMVQPEEALEAVKIVEAAIMSAEEKRTIILRDVDIF